MPQISISTSEAIEPTLREVAKDSARKIHTEYHKNSSPLFYRYSDTESFPSNLANLYGSIFNGYFSMHHENKEIVLLWGSEEVDPVLGWNKNVLYRQRELFNHISSDYIQDVDFDAKHWQCPLFSNRDVIIPFGVKHAYITTSRKRENRNSTITLASSARVDSLVVEADRFFIKEHVELRAKFLKLNIKNTLN